MALEIERKYRILELDRSILPEEGLAIDQGYLARGDTAIVRVRTKGAKAFLTIKAANEPRESGEALRRREFEYEIPVDEARQLLELCPDRLTKTRYDLESGVEIDLFEGELEGLILAEYESPEGSQVDPPPGVHWVEVTGDHRYANAWLARHGMPRNAQPEES